jgi:hypothetical protein
LKKIRNKKLFIYLVSSNIQKSILDENDLLDRLKDDFDSQPEFHSHLFGLGGRGRLLSTHLPAPVPSLHRHHQYT